MASSDKVSLTMDKTKAHDAITLALLQRFETAKWAAKQAHDAAINEESVAENKYDTFGLEASYLAHGQSQRVLECQTDWQLFEKKQAVLYGDGLAGLWCLVTLSRVGDSESEKYYFISPCAGGLSLEVDDKSLYLVTLSSPVGKLLTGKSVGDSVDLLQGGVKLPYEIINIE
ncbi:MAG: transcription elongation factor GreAB [Marinomonas sp.]